MIYYTSTLNSCENLNKKQNEFLNYPNDNGTLRYDTPHNLQNTKKYTLCIDEGFYNTLTDAQKSKCTTEMPLGYQWEYEQ